MPKFLCSNFTSGTELYDELNSSEVLGSEKQCCGAQGGQGSLSLMPKPVNGGPTEETHGLSIFPSHVATHLQA